MRPCIIDTSVDEIAGQGPCRRTCASSSHQPG
jgi:hypothetical protein